MMTAIRTRLRQWGCGGLLAVFLSVIWAGAADAACTDTEKKIAKIRAAKLALKIKQEHNYELDNVYDFCSNVGSWYRIGYNIRQTGYKYVFLVVGSNYVKLFDAALRDSGKKTRESVKAKPVALMMTEVWNEGKFDIRYKTYGEVKDAAVTVVIMKKRS